MYYVMEIMSSCINIIMYCKETESENYARERNITTYY